MRRSWLSATWMCRQIAGTPEPELRRRLDPLWIHKVLPQIFKARHLSLTILKMITNQSLFCDMSKINHFGHIFAGYLKGKQANVTLREGRVQVLMLVPTQAVIKMYTGQTTWRALCLTKSASCKMYFCVICIHDFLNMQHSWCNLDKSGMKKNLEQAPVTTCVAEDSSHIISTW